MLIMKRFLFALVILLFSIGSIKGQNPSLAQLNPSEAFINEEFCYITTLQNTGPNAGYGPYLQLFLPPGVILNSASLIGESVTVIPVGVFNGVDPLRDPNLNSGTLQDSVNYLPGWSFVIVKPPVGSITTGGTILEIELCFTMPPPTVTVGVPQNIVITPVYQFGDTPTGDNGPIFGPQTTGTIIPTLYTFDKRSDAPKGDRPPGPSWPITYTLEVDIANGMTITNLVFDDVLPDVLQWDSIISVSPGCTIIQTPDTFPDPGGTIQVTCPNATGTLGPTDVFVTYQAYILDTLDETIGDGADCDTEPVVNVSTFDAAEDLPETDSNTVTAYNITMQHAANPDTVSPGQTVNYSIDYQISDFITAVDSFVLTIVVADGLTYQGNATINGNPITPATTLPNTPGPGQTTVTFFITSAIGNLPPGGSGTLTYQCSVDQSYTSTGAPVLTRDILTNGAILDYHLTDEVGNNGCSYLCPTDVVVNAVELDKVVLFPDTLFVPGDTVVYQITMNILSGDADSVIITDFLPLPVHDVSDINTNWGTPHIIPTAAHTVTNIPTVTADSATNALIFDFGNVSSPDSISVIQFNISVPVTTIPFADGLFHSNILEAETNSSSGDGEIEKSITLIKVGAPELMLTKGVSMTSNPASVITPASGFPIDGDAVGNDGSDTITFVATIQNMGGATAFDVQFSDTVTAGFSSCALVSVTRGDGSPFPFAPTGNLFTSPNDTLFLDSLQAVGAPNGGDVALITYQCIVDPTAPYGLEIVNTASAIWASATGQTNTFTPIYDSASVTLTNPVVTKDIEDIFPGYRRSLNQVAVGEVVQYRVELQIPEGQTPNVIMVDSLDIGLAFVSLDSIFADSSLSTSIGSFNDVLNNAVISASGIGATADDRRLTLDFGTLNNQNNVDSIPELITLYYSVKVLNSTGNIDGRNLNNQARIEWIDPNDGGTISEQGNAPNVTVREPQLRMIKTFLTNNVQRGDEVFVNLDFVHTGNSNATAFDLALQDTLPTGLVFVLNSITHNCASLYRSGPSASGNTIYAELDSLPLGSACNIEFKIRIDDAIPECDTATNCSGITWESLSDADQPGLGAPFSNQLGFERTGNPADPGQVNDYEDEDCAGLNIINGLAVDPVITSNSPVCELGTAILMVNSYSGQVVNYSWFGPDSTAISNNSNQLVISNVSQQHAGAYYVIVDVDGCVSDTSQIDTLVVLANPVVSPTNDGMLCSPNGTPLNLFANPSGGSAPYFFTWTGPNNFSSNDQDPVILNANSTHSGTYNVFVTDTNGCISAPASTVAQFSNQPNVPTITTNSPLCEGQMAVLTATTYTGSNVTYTWTGPGVPPNTTGNTFTINPVTVADAGTYTVFVNVDGCLSDTSNGSILTISPIPQQPTPSYNSPICSGDTLFLMANPPAIGGPFTYSWTGPNNFMSSMENPVIPGANANQNGSYTVTITSSAGCSNSASVQVAINPTPAPPAISSGGQVCEGDLFTFTTSAYSGQIVEYIWSLPGGGTDTTSLPQLDVGPVTLADSGQYGVIVIVDGCISLSGPTAVLDVDLIPSVIASGTGTFCEGDGATLTSTVTASGPFSILWTGPNGYTSTQSNPILTSLQPSSSGIYTATVTHGACSASDTVSLTVIPAPNPPSLYINGSVCHGDTLVLNTNDSATVYTWTSPLGNIYTTTPPLLIPPSSPDYVNGDWTLTVTDSNGCQSPPSSPETVFITPIPGLPTASSNSPVCIGQNIELYTALIPGATYQWFGPNGFTSTQQNPVIPSATLADSGNYRVVVAVNGCLSDTSAPTQVQVTEAAIVVVLDDTLYCSNGNVDIHFESMVMGGNGPFTFYWAGPNGFASTDSVAVIPNADSTDAGPYILLVTDSLGCQSQPVTATLHVTNGVPTPTLSGPIVLCEGDQLQLTTTHYQGDSVTYFWNTPLGQIVTSIPSLVINPVQLSDSGDYSVWAYVDGCVSLTSGAQNIDVMPAPATPNPMAIYADPTNCSGDTLFLTTPNVPGYTYSWSGPNGFAGTGSSVFVPNAGVSANGSYTVVVSNGTCTSSASVTFNSILPIPATPVISVPGPFCEGDVVIISSNTYSGGAVQYIWNTPTGLDTLPGAGYILNPVTYADSGDYFLQVTVNGCPSQVSGTILVDVHPTPVAPVLQSSGNALCEGDTLVLSTNSMGDGYWWTGPNGFNSQSQNPPAIYPLSSADAGVYQLALIVDGCTSQVATDTVSVDPIPATPTIVANPGTICFGDTIDLNSSASCSGFYWISPAGSSATTLSNPLLTTMSGNTQIPAGDSAYLDGNWSVICVSPNGCQSALSSPVNISITPLPAPPTASHNGPTCAGDDIQLSATNIAGGNYAWYGPDSFYSTQQNPVIFGASLTNAGDYYVTVEVNGCSSDSSVSTTVQVVEPAVVTVPDDSLLCANGNTPISLNPTVNGGIAPLSFSWTGPNNFASSDSIPIISSADSTDAGAYTLVVTDAHGCQSQQATGNLHITNGIPTPNISGQVSLCEGEALQLNSNSYQGDSVLYIWSLPTLGYDSTPSPSLVINPVSLADSGIYSLVAYADGCHSLPSNTPHVQVIPRPATPNTTATSTNYCEGDTLILGSSTSASGYLWSGPDAFGSTSQYPAAIYPLSVLNTGIYSLAVIENGCTSAVALDTINVSPRPTTPVISAASTNLCEGDTLTLSTTAGCDSYLWYRLPNSPNTSVGHPLLNTTTPMTQIPHTDPVYEAGDWSVICINTNGCRSFPSVPDSIRINDKPDAPFASATGPHCVGDQIDLTGSAPIQGTYAWSGPNFTSYLQNPSISNATLLDSGLYFLQLIVNGCASDSDTVAVVVNAIPQTPQPTSNSPTCEGDSLELFANVYGNQYTYAWSGPNLSSTQPDPVLYNVTPNDAGQYFLSVMVNGCESAQGVESVVVFPSVDPPIITNNGPLCEGQTLLLECDPYTGANVEYVWSGPGISPPVTTSDPIYTDSTVTLSDTGFYTVVVQVSGCSSAAGIPTEVEVHPVPTAQIGVTDTAVCEGETISLTALSPGDHYLWSGPNGYSDTLAQPASIPNAQLVNAGYYTLTVSNDGCSSAMDSVEIMVSPVPAQPTLFANDTNLCIGDLLILTTDSAGNGTYHWTGPNGFNATTTDTFYQIDSVHFVHSGTYEVGYSELGCASAPSLSISVTVDSIPGTSAYAGEDRQICEGQQPIMLAPGTQTNGTWSTNSSATIISEDNPVTGVLGMVQGETYIFYWTLSNRGCLRYSQDSVVVEVSPPPIAVNDNFEMEQGAVLEGLFLEENDTDRGVPSSVNIITDPRHGELDYVLNPDGNYTPEPTYYGEDTFYYALCYNACPDDCDSARVTITIHPDLFIPDLITPNGDGVNDELIIVGIEQFPDNELIIFNRWGNEVYTASPYQNDWEGAYNGGKLPAGTYFYIFTNSADGTELAHGYITLHSNQ